MFFFSLAERYVSNTSKTMAMFCLSLRSLKMPYAFFLLKDTSKMFSGTNCCSKWPQCGAMFCLFLFWDYICSFKIGKITSTCCVSVRPPKRTDLRHPFPLKSTSILFDVLFLSIERYILKFIKEEQMFCLWLSACLKYWVYIFSKTAKN